MTWFSSSGSERWTKKARRGREAGGMFIGAAITATTAVGAGYPIKNRYAQSIMTVDMIDSADLGRLHKQGLVTDQLNKGTMDIGSALVRAVACASARPGITKDDFVINPIKKSDELRLDVQGLGVFEGSKPIKEAHRSVIADDLPLEKSIELAFEALERFKAQQWTFKSGPRDEQIDIPVSDFVDEVTKRLQIYVTARGALLQVDPISSAALRGFTCLLQFASTAMEMAPKITEMIFEIFELTKMCKPYRDWYKHSKTTSGKKVYNLVEQMDQAVGEFSTKAQEYYLKSTILRIVEALNLFFQMDFDPKYQRIKLLSKELKRAYKAAQLDEERREKIFNWLSKFPVNDVHATSRNVRHENTCTWHTYKLPYRQWKELNSSSLLWINGNAGTGKTVLISKIIDDLGKQHSDPQNPVAYFYCTEGQQRGTDPAILLATLLKQILSVQPDISDLVIASFEKHNKENSLSFEDAKSLLSETLKYLKLSSLHIVIDGIEKCDQALRIPLIRALNDLLDPRKHSITTRVKMIISSRSEELVRKNIPHCHHSLPVDESNNDSDIEQYIRQLLDYTAPRLSHMSQVREELVEEVKNKARGIYSRAQELIDSALKDRGIKSGEGTEKEPLVGASRPEHTRSGYTDILTSMIPRRNRAETMGF